MDFLINYGLTLASWLIVFLPTAPTSVPSGGMYEVVSVHRLENIGSMSAGQAASSDDNNQLRRS